MHEDFQAEINKTKTEESRLRKELNELADTRRDLDCKLQQRQHLVIQLQSQLSMLECELDECKAENENLVSEMKRQATSLSISHGEEIEKFRKELEAEKNELREERDSEIKENSQLRDSVHAEYNAKKAAEEKLAKIQCEYSDVCLLFLYKHSQKSYIITIIIRR